MTRDDRSAAGSPDGAPPQVRVRPRSRSAWLHRIASLVAVALAPALASAQGPSRPKIALALGGGAAKGIAHVGVLAWLEEHHIPVDLVAGTSMGGLVGGSYALGMTPQEIEDLLERTDWDLVFMADAPFREKTFRRKQDTVDYPVDLELGLKHGLSLPSGLNPGHHIGVLLSRIALAHSTVTDFDDLPIPFRCLAADMKTGEEVVLDRGPLDTALRATMAIPAYFDPVFRDGRLLADGGVLNNVPVDVARGMGADVVIAVKVDSAEPEPPETMLGLGFHAIGLMMEHLTEPRLDQADLVVRPNLVGVAGTDYRRSRELVQLGYQAAAVQADGLLKLALDEPAWQAHLAARRARIRKPPRRIDFFEVSGLGEGEASRLQDRLDLRLGSELDQEALAIALSRVVGTGRYAAAAYRLRERGDHVGLDVSVREKRHAPPLVNFFTDLGNQGEDITFDFGARATFMDLTTYGSELRVDAGLGSIASLGGELFQPLGSRGLFAAVGGGHFRINENLYQDDDLVAVFRRKQSVVSGDLGWLLASAQLRVGYEVAHLAVDPRVGPAPVEGLSGREQAVHGEVAIDTRDAAFFARGGLGLETRFTWYLEAADTQESFGRLSGTFSVPFAVGPWSRGLVRTQASTLVGPDAPLVYSPSLGGPFRLSSFGVGSFRGRRALLGQVGYLHSVAKLPDPLGDRLFAVGLVEVGSAFDEATKAEIQISGTAGLAFDGYFGPVFLGASVGSHGTTRVFFTFGRLIR